MMKEQQLRYLDAMGIQVWQRRGSGVPTADERREVRDEEGYEEAPSVPVSRLSPSVASDVSVLDWNALKQRVQECKQCPESAASRSQSMFGVGNQSADWMVIGEAPGGEEDSQGKPFAGGDGELLNAMLAAIELRRQQVYLTTAVKCLPPDHRAPLPVEAAACKAYLQREIALVQPQVILALGPLAAQSLLSTETDFDTLRGKVHYLESAIPLVVTFSLSELRRSPEHKRKAWSDLCLARSMAVAAARSHT